MRDENYYMGWGCSFQTENYYLNVAFEPKKSIFERYGTNPCAEIVLETHKKPNRKLLLLL